MSPFKPDNSQGWTSQRVWEPYSRRWILQVTPNPQHTCSESPEMQKYHDNISNWLKSL
jgi:hypothetical protein